MSSTVKWNALHRSWLLLFWMCSSVARKLCDWVPFVATGISCDYCFVCSMSLEGAATEAMKTYVKTEIIGANAG